MSDNLVFSSIKSYSFLLGVVLLGLAILLMLKPEILAFLLSGVLFFVGIGLVSVAICFRKAGN